MMRSFAARARRTALPLLAAAILLAGCGTVSGTDTANGIRLRGLETLDAFVAANPMVRGAFDGYRSGRAIFVFSHGVHFTAEAWKGRPGFSVAYETASCRILLPPTREMSVDFDAGRATLIEMSTPLKMLTLPEALDLARRTAASLAAAGGRQIKGVQGEITEAAILAQGGEKSIVAGEWTMCDSAIICRLTVQFHGQRTIGTGAPLWAASNPFFGRPDHYLVDLDLYPDDAIETDLVRKDGERSAAVPGKTDGIVPLVEWLHHPEWYASEP